MQPQSTDPFGRPQTDLASPPSAEPAQQAPVTIQPVTLGQPTPSIAPEPTPAVAPAPPAPVAPTPAPAPAASTFMSYNSSVLAGQVSEDPDQPDVAPIPVVHVLSPRGVEYVMLTIALFTGAIGLTAILLCLVYGETGFSSLSFPIAMLLVGLPLFAGFFLRLKGAELDAPRLKLDQSKRRSTQFTQIVSFLVCLGALLGLLSSVFAAIGGDVDDIGKAIGAAIIILIVFGGILAYYWWDEHKL